MFGRSCSSAHIDTLIGKSTRVEGDVEFSGGLHVDGQVSGHVRALEETGSSLEVSESGCIEGSVLAAHVVVNGVVRGDIHGRERVVLGATARVHGNVYYGLIESATGAEIRGKLVPVVPLAPPAGSAAGSASGSVSGPASPADDSVAPTAHFDPVAGAS